MGNGPSALHQAVLSGELDAVRKAIQDQPGVVDASEPSNGWSALHMAAAKGFDVIARELLARGAGPNLIDKEGRTPLHLAAGQGHTGVMRDLLRRGSDPLRRDAAGKTPLDAALEQQQAAAVSLLSDALAGRGIPSNPTPTGSPTKGQGAANQQQQQYYQAAGTGQVVAPNIAALDLGGGYGAAGGGGGGGSSNPAYPAVPAPYVADDSWLSRLPPPPPGSGGGDWGGPVSVASAPSAPPVSNVAYLQQQQPQQQQLRQQQQQQQQAAVDYYDFIRPTAPQAAAAPAAPPLAAGHAYPPVPSAAPGASIDSYAGGGPQQQQQQQQQPKQQPWWQRLAPQRPPQQEQQQSQQPAPVAAAAAPSVAQQPVPPPAQQQLQQQADEDDDGWGGAGRNDADDDDGWGGVGGSGVSSSQAAGVSTAAAAGGGGGGGRTPAASKSQPPNLNAAVGAAVSGAGKVAGAMGSIAVAGAKQLLKGVMQQPQGDDDDDDYEQDESATWAGAPGRVYSYAELAAATKGFSAGNKLGAGGYGPVFRGVLDGLPVAVKLLDPAAAGAGGQQGPKEFAAEVAILSRLHHPHIVLLIGSCPERCGLVYELMEGGSLEQHLFNPGMPQLCWQDRVRIACEVASALCFLHSAPEPIVHMDLKPGNLLLNRSLVCKVGDVGLSRLMPGASRGGRTAGGSGGPVSTIMDSRLVGTPCYMDPEYLRTGRFGPKSDVYSLGVILLQMLTGLEASRVVAVVEAALARSQGDAASFASITDPRAGAWPITEAACLAHLAMRCVELQRGNRPDLRGELLPALMQLAERSRLFGGCGGGGASAQRSSSLSAGSSGGPPSMMICPITQDVMLDPVFAADGYTYEREAIAGWVATHSTSPMTNLALANKTLTPNLTLRSAIKEWEERQAGGGR